MYVYIYFWKSNVNLSQVKKNITKSIKTNLIYGKFQTKIVQPSEELNIDTIEDLMNANMIVIVPSS